MEASITQTHNNNYQLHARQHVGGAHRGAPIPVRARPSAGRWPRGPQDLIRGPSALEGQGLLPSRSRHADRAPSASGALL
mmetsp:Transcript_50900/g.132402  ORF Transcript_50900/g.132402 Transcript_50900/m.132402 type:complete len:80 (-) Transcript_50900:28-267(-)